MINPDETQLPDSKNNGAINISETVLPGKEDKGKNTIILLTDESFKDGYIIKSRLSRQGKQSDVYLAKKWGIDYVVKLYYAGWHPSNRMRSFLKNIKHPNIAQVIDCGDYKGHYYEIYDYYSEGTLEDVGELTIPHIKNVIVPSINEGLHVLHENGIVHCDIKPDNLYYADNCKRIIIGDCGVSDYTNADGKLVDTVRGTPEYAPRVKSLVTSATLSSAYDYGSFGLVLCKAVLGRSVFDGMSVEEISRAWEKGLELPSAINGRVRTLIEGLLNEDEEYRWGYIEVKRWCEGEFQSSSRRNVFLGQKKEKSIKPLIFGTFDGEVLLVKTLHQLERAIKQHWEQAKIIVKRRDLFEFVRQFGVANANELSELSQIRDSDAAVYKMLLSIQDNPMQIFYCGAEYENLSVFVDHLYSGTDETAKSFLSSGLLIYFLRFNNFENIQVEKLNQLIKHYDSSDMESIYTICYALKGINAIDIFGETVHSLKELIPVFAKQSIADIGELLSSSTFLAWLNTQGYEKETKVMKEEYG